MRPLPLKNTSRLVPLLRIQARQFDTGLGIAVGALKRQLQLFDNAYMVYDIYDIFSCPALNINDQCLKFVKMVCFEKDGTCILFCITGLWLHKSGVLAASPDGLVVQPPTCEVHSLNRNCRLPTLIEVKCPYSAKDMTVAAAALTLKDFYLGKHQF